MPQRAHPILELGERIASPADLLTEIGEQEDREERKRLEMEGEGAPARRGDAQAGKVGERQREQRDRVPTPSDPHARQAVTPCRRSSAVPAMRSTSQAITAGTKLMGMAINGRTSGFEDSAAAAMVSSQPKPSVAAKNVGNG